MSVLREMGANQIDADADDLPTLGVGARDDDVLKDAALDERTSPISDSRKDVVERLTRNRLLAGIFIILAFNLCSAAATLIVVWILALLLSLMLAPAVRFLCVWHIPRFMAALLVVTFTIVLTGLILASLIAPARAWMILEVPVAITRIEVELGRLRQPLVAAANASEKLAKLTNIDSDNSTLRFVDAGPSRLAQMLSATPTLITGMAIVLLLTFIFLVHGNALLRKFVELAPALHLKKDIVRATRSAQNELSTYMVTIVAINAMVGLLTASALWYLGIADPLLWGGVAAVLNFAPFIGPMLTVTILTVVGFTRFATPLAALSVPGIFLILHLIEAELITPLIVGRRMALDPVMVFLALMLFGWLWGVPGLLLAMPLLSCVRIVAERVPAWRGLAKLLGK